MGLAFEKNTAYNKIKERERALADPGKKDEAAAIEITDYDTELQSIDITEIFHYSFNYIGILTGTFYFCGFFPGSKLGEVIIPELDEYL